MEPEARYGKRDFALRLVKRSLAEFLDDSCPQLAASITYHVLFSVFPLAIVLAGISGIVLNATGSQANAVDTIVRNVPLSASGQSQFRHLLLGATGNLAAIGLVGLFGLVYSASGMMAALRTALNQAWDLDEVRPFLRGKLIDLGLVSLVAVLSVGSLGLTVLLHVIGGGFFAFSFAVPLVVGFAIVVFLYRVVPAADVRLGDIWPAALFVAVAFMAAENLFALYVGHFGHYNAVYGSLGAVIAFMYFVYLSSELFLLGAEVASEWPRVREALERGEVEAPAEGPPLRQQVREALLGLWVRRRQEEEGIEDSAKATGDTTGETTTEGDSDADPHRPGGNGDRGDPRGVAGGAGRRPADQRHDRGERGRLTRVRGGRGTDRG
ncbi:MAG: YihY/virulence factor BrkB family protein [Gaiellaceae bacterium]